MADSYTKLFASITESTIWTEPAGTRLVWITMLAKANRHGEVYASVPGLARLANVSLEDAERALTTFLSPDKYSRTPDHEGRRIEPIDGGWRLLNFAKFDRQRSEIEAKEREAERKREWDRKNRANRPNANYRGEPEGITPDVPPTKSDAPPTFSDAPPTPTPDLKDQELLPSAGAEAPVADPIWHTGLAFLRRKGLPEVVARKFLGKLKREAGDIDAAALLAQAEAEDITEPIPWLSAGAVSARNKRSTGGRHATGTQGRNLSAVERVEQAIRDRRDAEARNAVSRCN